MTTSVRQSTRTRDARWLIGVAMTLTLASLRPGVALAQGNSQNISGNISVDFSHAYFFRGIAQESEGLVTQPAADIAWSLFEAPGRVGAPRVCPTHLGVWNSLHTGPTGSGTGGSATHVRSWYESDFFTGVSLDIDNWEAGITYTSYMSPNASFRLGLGDGVQPGDGRRGVLRLVRHEPARRAGDRARRPGGRRRQRGRLSRGGCRARPARHERARVSGVSGDARLQHEQLLRERRRPVERLRLPRRRSGPDLSAADDAGRLRRLGALRVESIC